MCQFLFIRESEKIIHAKQNGMKVTRKYKISHKLSFVSVSLKFVHLVMQILRKWRKKCLVHYHRKMKNKYIILEDIRIIFTKGSYKIHLKKWVERHGVELHEMRVTFFFFHEFVGIYRLYRSVHTSVENKLSNSRAIRTILIKLLGR